MSTTVLATIGAGSVVTGGGFLAWAKRPKTPRYRIVDNVVKGGYWSYDGTMCVQKKGMFGWRTVKKIRVQSDNSYTFNNAVEECREYVKIKLGVKDNIVFDSERDDINEL